MTDSEGSGCCGASRADLGGSSALPAPAVPEPARAVIATEFVRLPGGVFEMGADDADGFAADGEGPVRQVGLAPLRIAAHAVTNAAFAEFADATGYVTEAERFGWSYVFAGFLPGSLRKISPRPEQTPWWCGVEGAYWRAPEGPGSAVEERWDHPAVHVSWHDAVAYCQWSGTRLPTEAEWEYAARGGRSGQRYPWGDDLTPDGRHMCNIWQGQFPVRNTAEDGYRGTAPVNAFEPNEFGLYNVAGNVWEWCADWWTIEHDPAPPADPAGPADGSAKVMRGGSYLCHHSYCNRYRAGARTSNTPDSSSGNTGFRVVAAQDTL